MLLQATILRQAHLFRASLPSRIRSPALLPWRPLSLASQKMMILTYLLAQSTQPLKYKMQSICVTHVNLHDAIIFPEKTFCPLTRRSPANNACAADSSWRERGWPSSCFLRDEQSPSKEFSSAFSSASSKFLGDAAKDHGRFLTDVHTTFAQIALRNSLLSLSALKFAEKLEDLPAARSLSTLIYSAKLSGNYVLSLLFSSLWSRISFLRLSELLRASTLLDSTSVPTGLTRPLSRIRSRYLQNLWVQPVQTSAWILSNYNTS